MDYTEPISSSETEGISMPEDIKKYFDQKIEELGDIKISYTDTFYREEGDIAFAAVEVQEMKDVIESKEYPLGRKIESYPFAVMTDLNAKEGERTLEPTTLEDLTVEILRKNNLREALENKTGIMLQNGEIIVLVNPTSFMDGAPSTKGELDHAIMIPSATKNSDKEAAKISSAPRRSDQIK
jgi:hypothetical protein